MPIVSLVGIDSAGGLITGALAPFFTINGAPIALVGAAVAPHPPGIPPHTASVMAQGSAIFTVNGIPVCREGDMASCGHAATGSSNMTSD